MSRLRSGRTSLPSRRRAQSERGGGSLLMIGVMTVFLMLSLAGVCISGYLVAVHRARAAADLAALSGAVALNRGDDGCASARRNARANDAQVTSCSHVGDAIDFVITVEAEVQVGAVAPGLPSTVRAVAYAGAGAQGPRS